MSVMYLICLDGDSRGGANKIEVRKTGNRTVLAAVHASPMKHAPFYTQLGRRIAIMVALQAFWLQIVVHL